MPRRKLLLFWLAEFLMHNLKMPLPVPLNSSVLNRRKRFDIFAFLTDVNLG